MKEASEEEETEYGEIWLWGLKEDGSRHIVACVLGFWSPDYKRTDEDTLVLLLHSKLNLREGLIYFLAQAGNPQVDTVIQVWADAVLVDEGPSPYRFNVFFFAPTPEAREERKKRYVRGDWAGEMQAFEEFAEREETPEKTVVN